MRIANIEKNTSNWVSISSAGALDVTLSDFSMRSAPNEMRRVVGSSTPDVIIGSDEAQNRDARRRTKITWNSCVSCTKRRRRVVDTSYIRADSRSGSENEMHDEDHGHARSENSRSRSVHVCFGWT